VAEVRFDAPAEAADQGLTETEAGLHAGDPPVGRDRVGRS
jgi:hypothetical protein